MRNRTATFGWSSVLELHQVLIHSLLLAATHAATRTAIRSLHSSQHATALTEIDHKVAKYQGERLLNSQSTLQK